MEKILWDFSKTNGKIKPVNAVNNGPAIPSVRSTNSGSVEIFKKARIPYARNHDASFYIPYGGEHIVDVHRIFKNFNADENDPASYWFEPTDAYLKSIQDVGTKVFYRLGASIEHHIKFGTVPPADFEKWARICEHIIMHYTEGWANGFYYDIEYWEIWNEPDCHNHDGSNPCWQGTEDEFIDFFVTVSKYLKNRFPNLKIGGPALCSIWWDEGKWFLEGIKKEKPPMDFFSYHWYGAKLDNFKLTLHEAQKQIKEAGYEGIETILNEWNYVRGWLDENWKYSLKTEKNLKGASFILGAMCIAQEGPLDMLMYYDARPCGMNGIFDMETYKELKPFYAFLMMSDLAENGEYVMAKSSVSDIYTCASKGEDEADIVITYFDDNDDGYYSEEKVADKKKTVSLELENLFVGDKLNISMCLLDEDNDNTLVNELVLDKDTRILEFDIGLYSSYYIKIVKK